MKNLSIITPRIISKPNLPLQFTVLLFKEKLSKLLVAINLFSKFMGAIAPIDEDPSFPALPAQCAQVGIDPFPQLQG